MAATVVLLWTCAAGAVDVDLRAEAEETSTPNGAAQPCDPRSVFAPPVRLPAGDFSLAAAVADFDGDGLDDLVFTQIAAHRIRSLISNGDGTFAPPVDYSTGANSNPFDVVAADLDGDGAPDLAATGRGRRSVRVLLNAGDGTFGAVAEYSIGASAEQVEAGDIDNDGDLDLAVAELGGGEYEAGFLLNNGDGTFAPALLLPEPTDIFLVTGIALGDIDSDGNLDFASFSLVDSPGSEAFNALYLHYGNGDATFEPPRVLRFDSSIFDGTGRLTKVAIGDTDGNGANDIVVATELGPTVWGNGGGRAIESSQLFNLRRSTTGVTLADVDSNGDDDVLVGIFSGEEFLLLAGDFAFDQTVTTGQEVYETNVGDVDGDGDLDVIVTYFDASGEFSLVMNQCDPFLPPSDQVFGDGFESH